MTGTTKDAIDKEQSIAATVLSQPKLETMEPLDSKDAVFTDLSTTASSANLSKVDEDVANTSKMDIADDLEISESDDDDDEDDNDDNEDACENFDGGHNMMPNMVDVNTNNNPIKEENKYQTYNINSDQKSINFSHINISEGGMPVNENILPSISQNFNDMYVASTSTDRSDDPSKDPTIAVKDVKTINESELEMPNIQDDNDNDDDGWMRF